MQGTSLCPSRSSSRRLVERMRTFTIHETPTAAHYALVAAAVVVAVLVVAVAVVAVRPMLEHGVTAVWVVVEHTTSKLGVARSWWCRSAPQCEGG